MYERRKVEGNCARAADKDTGYMKKCTEDKEKEEYLRQYGRLSLRIDRLCGELARWRERSLRLGRAFGEVRGGQREDRVQASVDGICEMEEEIHDDLTRLKKARRAIQDVIALVPDDTFRVLLEYRYIDGMTWEQIAKEMNYSYQWICHLHTMALHSVPVEAVRQGKADESVDRSSYDDCGGLVEEGRET